MSNDALTVVKFSKDDYHIPEPRRPSHDLRAWSLWMPAIVGGVGLAAFAMLAFSFDELDSFNKMFRVSIVIVGAATLAVGGEIGTLFTNIEIFRKVAGGTVTKWDWRALAISILATIMAFILAAARLLGEDVEWSEFAKNWVMIALIVVVALDQYAGQMELGLYVGTYDKRYRDWEKGYMKFLDRMAKGYGLERRDLLNSNAKVQGVSELVAGGSEDAPQIEAEVQERAVPSAERAVERSVLPTERSVKPIARAVPSTEHSVERSAKLTERSVAPTEHAVSSSARAAESTARAVKPVADVQDFREIYVNDGAEFENIAMIAQTLSEAGFSLPTVRALYNWLKEVQEFRASDNGDRIRILAEQGKSVEEIVEATGRKVAVVRAVLRDCEEEK